MQPWWEQPGRSHFKSSLVELKHRQHFGISGVSSTSDHVVLNDAVAWSEEGCSDGDGVNDVAGSSRPKRVGDKLADAESLGSEMFT